jgi:hypothetical protein
MPTGEAPRGSVGRGILTDVRGPRQRPGDAFLGRIVAACACALLSSMLWAAPAAYAAPDLLPDLVAEPPTSPQPLTVERLGDGRDHLLLRFDGSIHNVGPGRLEIRGSQPVNGAMTVSGQRIYGSDGSFRDDNSRHPPIHYENTDRHRHWHLKGAARYSLWDEAGTTQAAPASKVGFCLLDSERVDSFGPGSPVYTRSATQYCREGQPNAAQVFEGISAGWLDYYPFDLPFQWVDVSDVSPGRYRLASAVDPDNYVYERNEANNGPALASAIVTVPGYVALPGTIAAGGAQAIGLTAQPYGSPGPPVFAIESAPANGTLNVPAGAPLATPQVVYTPRPGFAGTDTFTYSARDSSSAFPTRARAGVVTVTVPSASSSGRLRLLTGLRFRRHGRFLRVRGRATRSGVLRIHVRKGKRRLGSCRRRVRSGRRFNCRIRLPRHASLIRARAIVTLSVNGMRAAVDTYRVRRGG